jgi:hypothetical protein
MGIFFSRFRAHYFCTFFFLLFTSFVPANVIYVNQNLPGTIQDGTTWDTAFLSIQPAIICANAGDEIRVAGGSYIENLVLKDGIALLGGFAGNETSSDQRNWNAHITIIDGNANGNAVLIPQNAGSTTCIDGFTITNGNAAYGGGILCSESSSPKIAHNKIKANSAVSGGGGICCLNSASPLIVNNIIIQNISPSGSGIELSSAFGSTKLINNTIHECPA